MRECINKEPPHNIIITIGDLNARVGDDSHQHNPQIVGKHTYHRETNDNGNRLIELCQSTQLRLVQSRFPQPDKSLWTWRHPKGSVAQLDHILVNGKWIRSVTNCRAYNSLEIGSDQRILSARFKIRFRFSKGNPCQRPRYNWDKLIDEPATQAIYATELSNRFSLLRPSSDDNIQQFYDDTTRSISETAKEVLGAPPKRQAHQWVSKTTLELLNNRNIAKRRFQQRKTKNLKTKWQELYRQVQKAYEKDEQTYLGRQITQLETANRHKASRRTWKIINEISGTTPPNPASKVKKCDGTILKNVPELLDEWRKYFSGLLNAPPVTNTREIPASEENLDIRVDGFTLEEVRAAIKSLNNYKAPGVDHSITSEALKYGGEDLERRLLKLTNAVKNKLEPPKEWIKNIIIPLPKKGDRTKMSNYRGISPMSVTAKLYNRLLLNRIREPL